MGRRLRRYLEDDTRVGWVRLVSDGSAKWVDKIPGMTPNRMTYFGLLLALGATYFFLTGLIIRGAIFCTLSYVTDFLDGALARYQDERMTEEERQAQRSRHWMARRGKSETTLDNPIFTGAAFDPFVDKVRYFGAVLPLGIGRLWWPLLALGGLFALALTIGRPIVAKLNLSKGKSNWLGKHKVHVEAVLLAWLVFVPATFAGKADDVLLALATLGGAVSFAGQAYSVWKNHKDAKAPT